MELTATESMWLEMIDMQERLNISTNGKEWITGKTKDGKTINWDRCIRQELSELVDSIPWKHWKDISDDDIDWDNCKMEYIDTVHFIISKYLKLAKDKNMTNESLAVILAKEHNGAIRNRDNLLYYTEELIKDSFDDRIHTTVYNMRMLEYQLDLTTKDVYLLYLSKNLLNQFRQDNGYKDGSYQKILYRDGKPIEDNKLLQECLVKHIDDYKQGFLLFKKLYDDMKE